MNNNSKCFLILINSFTHCCCFFEGFFFNFCPFYVTNILEIEAEMKQAAHQTHCYILKLTFRLLVYW